MIKKTLFFFIAIFNTYVFFAQETEVKKDTIETDSHTVIIGKIKKLDADFGDSMKDDE